MILTLATRTSTLTKWYIWLKQQQKLKEKHTHRMSGKIRKTREGDKISIKHPKASRWLIHFTVFNISIYAFTNSICSEVLCVFYVSLSSKSTHSIDMKCFLLSTCCLLQLHRTNRSSIDLCVSHVIPIVLTLTRRIHLTELLTVRSKKWQCNRV